MAIKFFNNIDTTGEIQGTSLDINGSADISGSLTVTDPVTITGPATASLTGVLDVRDDSGNTSLRFGGNSTYSWIQSHSSKPLRINELGNNVSFGTGTVAFGGDVTIINSIIHAGDTNTYFGFHNADEWRVVTGGTERLEVSNSGIKLSSSGSTVNTILDEDAMGSNSATALATQQSIKAYVDSAVSSVGGGDATLAGTQTFTGAKTFTSASNHYNGHRYYDAYDTNGNHYPHFLDGSGNTGTTINWRQSYGSSYKTHTWASDASGNMLFTYQGGVTATGALTGGSLDINGNADISGNLNVTGNITNASWAGDVIASNKLDTDTAHLSTAQTFTGQKFFDASFEAHPLMLSGAQNFDNIDRSGFYNLYNTHTSSTNSPGFDYGTMIAIGNDKGGSGFGLQLAHQRTGGAGQLQVRGMNDTASAWSAWNTVYTSADTAAVANGVSTIATGDQIYDHVTTRISGLATESYVNTAVSNLVDSAPGALNTLNELAAALGDDADFSTTVTNSIAAKLPLAGGTMTGNVNLADSKKLQLGASQDLEIYHDGTDNQIVSKTGDLVITNTAHGEQIYFKAENGSGTLATYFQVDGASEILQVHKDLYALDSVKLRAGNSGDLQMYHDGSNSYVENVTGDFYIRNKAADKSIVFQADDGSSDGSSIETYFQLEGASGGGSPFTVFPDNSIAAFGAGHDLRIYHDGSNSYIDETGTGSLIIKSSPIVEVKGANNENIARFIENGSVDLYYNNQLKFETSGDGVSVTGELQADSLDINGAADISGNLVLGSYTVASQGNQSVFGKLSSFQNSGSTNLLLGVKNGSYPNRGWSFDPVLTGVNCNLIIKEHGSTAERIKISTGGNFEVLTGSVTATGLDINGNADISGDVTIADGSNDVNLYLGNTSYGLQLDYSSGNMFFRTNSATRLTIENGGNATFAGDLTVTGSQYFNGLFIEGDGKEMFRYSDSWLRINEDNDFSSGIYCGSGILRTDGEFRIGNAGSSAKITSSGNATFAGSITTGGTNATVKADRFSGIGTGVVVGPNSNGTVFLRPEGVGSTGNQSTFTNSLATIGTNATFAGDLGVAGALYQTNNGITDNMGVFMPMVQGGLFATNASTTTGRLRVKIPTYKSLAMQTFYIDVYEYDTDRSATYRVSGYNYNDTSATWYNTSVVALFDSDNRDLTVRFGADTSASEQYVAIGETNTTWSYVQVVVRDYLGGYSTSVAEATAAFEIEFVTTDAATYNVNHDNNQPMANWSKIEGVPSTFTPNTSITDSISTTSSTTRASATAAKAAYDRGSTGVTNAASAQTTANAALPKAGGTMSGDLGIGITPVSTLHVYENNTEKSSSAGITVENDGTGDALVQYLLTGARRWVTGIDNSDSDNFKISSSADLGTDTQFTLDSSGNATFAGNINFGDSHFIGDDGDDNLLIQGSSSENVIIRSEDGLYFRTGGDNTRLTISSSGAATFAGDLTIPGYINHAGDSGTKLGFEGNDAFRLYTSSTMQLQIDSSGDATFAGSVTATSLDINGNADISGNLTGVDDLTMSGNIDCVDIDASGTITGDGSGIDTINGSNISSGTVAAARVATLNQNTTGNAATATDATNLNATDDRDMAPEDYGYANDFRVFFASKEGLEDGTSTGSNWQDVLYINSYIDSSGGDANALAFDKSTKAIYHYQADQAATNWGTAKQLAYTDSNISGNTTGSAATLTTARTIGGVSFNGSADIDLPGVSETGDQDTSGNAATATLAATSTTVTVAQVSNNATYYPTFVTGSGTSSNLKTDSTLTYNPNTDVLQVGKLTTDTAVIVENAKSNAALMTLTGAGAGNEANITLKLAGTVHGSPVKMKMVAENAEGDGVGNGIISFHPTTDTFGIGQTTTHNSMAILIDNNDAVSMKNETTFTNGIDVTSGTNSTSKTTGTVKIAGGVGIAKTLNVGEDVVAYASSDKRYKDNLQAITNPIDKVKSLTGYTFTWNDKHEQFNGNDDIGVVAQEVEKVFPEIVDTRDNGYKAVKYEKMVALLIEAVKDQQKQIDELKAVIDGNSK